MSKLREARKQAAREKRAQTQAPDTDKAPIAHETALYSIQEAEQTQTEQPTKEEDKKQAVAAAVARAKARKEALKAKTTDITEAEKSKVIKQETSDERAPDNALISNEQSDEKKAAVAAAIARVKARKKAFSAKVHKNAPKRQAIERPDAVSPQDKED